MSQNQYTNTQQAIVGAAVIATTASIIPAVTTSALLASLVIPAVDKLALRAGKTPSANGVNR